MDFDQYLKKTALSESVTDDREYAAEKAKPMEGYAAHPKEERLSELFDMRNSFDNISVGMDAKGSIAIAVTSQKEPYAPTLSSDRKVLKGTRRRTLYDHFGEIYTNPSCPERSAFAYRSRRAISENRITGEFKRAAQKRLSREQREAAPFLALDEDREALQALRGRQDNSPEMRRRIGSLEQTVLRETEMENRFVRKLRVARLQNVPKPEKMQRVMQSELYALTGHDGEDNAPDNDDENKDDNTVRNE